MSQQQVFQDYVQERFEQAGAVTPGQKKAVVEQMIADAHRGQVPIDENSVVTLDVNDASVQAVLRGESVSVGMGTPVRRKAKKGKGGLSETQRKIAILAAILLIPILLSIMVLFFRARGKAQAAAEAEAAMVEPTADLDTLLAMTQTAIAEDDAEAEATLPPLLEPSPTPDDVLYAPVEGDAAQELTNPASIELGGRLFILQEGEVDKKTGLWNPQQPEWLQETELRKVFALPRAYLEDAGIAPGTHALVRLRNSEIVDFEITTILRIPMNQIEVLSSNRPSLVILTIDETNGGGQDPQLERLVIVGEIPVPEQPPEMVNPKPLNAVIRYSADGAARLRAEPGLSTEVIGTLEADTVITVPYPIQRVAADDLTWVFIHAATGSGWIAEELIIYRP